MSHPQTKNLGLSADANANPVPRVLKKITFSTRSPQSGNNEVLLKFFETGAITSADSTREPSENTFHLEDVPADEIPPPKESLNGEQAFDIFSKGLESSQTKLSETMLTDLMHHIGSFKSKEICQYHVKPEEKDFDPETNSYSYLEGIHTEKEGLKIVVSKKKSVGHRMDSQYSKGYKVTSFIVRDGRTIKSQEIHSRCPIYSIFPYYDYLIMSGSTGISILTYVDTMCGTYFEDHECDILGTSVNDSIRACVLDQVGSSPSLVCVVGEIRANKYSLVRLGALTVTETTPRSLQLQNLFSVPLTMEDEDPHAGHRCVLLLDSQGKIWLQFGGRLLIYSPDFQLLTEAKMRQGALVSQGQNGDVLVCYSNESPESQE